MKVSIKQLQDSNVQINYAKLVYHLVKNHKAVEDTDLFSIGDIVDYLDLRSAQWSLKAVENHEKESRLLSVFCAKRVEHLITDKKVLEAIDIADKFKNGLVSIKELKNAVDFAYRYIDGKGYKENAIAQLAYNVLIGDDYETCDYARDIIEFDVSENSKHNKSLEKAEMRESDIGTPFNRYIGIVDDIFEMPGTDKLFKAFSKRLDIEYLIHDEKNEATFKEEIIQSKKFKEIFCHEC